MGKLADSLGFLLRLHALRPLRPCVALAPPAALQPGVGRAPERGRGPWQAPGGDGKSWEDRWNIWGIPWKIQEIPCKAMEKLANIQEIPQKMMCQDVLDLSCFVLDQTGMDPRSTITKKQLKVGKNISQWEGLSHILWKIKNVPNHQPVYIYNIITQNHTLIG